MKKLKIKIFWTIYIILSLFLITILGIFNFQDYSRAKNEIQKNLFRMSSDKNSVKEDNSLSLKTGETIADRIKDDPKRFMDETIYTVLLDSDNQISEIISHTEDGSVHENIQEVADEIVSENKTDKTYIGNLYFAAFSYNYKVKQFITIIDNTKVSQDLRSTLKISILLLIFGQIVIVVISRKLSKWLIKPIEENFNKQKQFIADASHELKTPLAVIMASADAMGDCKKEEKWLNNIKNESERMNKLITSLLDLTKASSERPVYEEVNFSKLVEISILTLESLTYEKNIKLDYNIEDDINLRCNSEQMKQLLSILLDNAVKHSCKQGKIIIKLRKNKNNVVLEVTNKGKPLPKGEEEKIFERFYRVDKSRNRNDNSYGLGLAIAKSIIENHDGHISASSSGNYTTFTVILKNKNINFNF